MLATRPSLEGKWGSGIWEWGCTAEWPYFWNAFTVLPVGHCFWKERNGVSVDMAAVFIYFNTELSFSIPSVLSCNFPLAFCASSLLNSFFLLFPFSLPHRLLIQLIKNLSGQWNKHRFDLIWEPKRGVSAVQVQTQEFLQLLSENVPTNPIWLDKWRWRGVLCFLGFFLESGKFVCWVFLKEWKGLEGRSVHSVPLEPQKKSTL